VQIAPSYRKWRPPVPRVRKVRTAVEVLLEESRRPPATAAGRPDPQLICECRPYCAGAKCGFSGREAPHTPIVRADGTHVPQLSIEEGIAWAAAYKASRGEPVPRQRAEWPRRRPAIA